MSTHNINIFGENKLSYDCPLKACKYNCNVIKSLHKVHEYSDHTVHL